MGFLRRLFGGKLTPDEFAAKYIETLRSLGDARSARYDKDQFQLFFTENGKESGSVNLVNIFAEYQRARRREGDEWLRTICLNLLASVDLPDDFEDASHDLRPTLRSPLVSEILQLTLDPKDISAKSLVTIPVSKYLCATLVYDMPHRMQFINHETLAAWHKTPYEAFEVALHNLGEMHGRIMVIGESVFVLADGDAYDATKMLRLNLIRGLPAKGTPIALPVNRDCLLITGEDDVDGIGVIADLAESKLGEPRPVCWIPHRLNGDDWDPWLPDASHPHFAKIKMLWFRHMQSEYAAQKEALDKYHEEKGIDIFIATLAGASEKDGPIFSYCVWSKGVVTWLPDSDRIGFYDDDSKQMKLAQASRVREIAGQLMEPIDCFPPRWLVKGFPTEAQLAAMDEQNL